jgi:hypothetical protein
MKGNFHVRFGGGLTDSPIIGSPLPTLPEERSLLGIKDCDACERPVAQTNATIPKREAKSNT